jgi:hypothetical protein
MTYYSPKWWKEFKELRKRNKLDQVISRKDSTEARRRAPGPGLKQQASSDKPQATETQAASDKHQASRHKPQASSRKRQAAR